MLYTNEWTIGFQHPTYGVPMTADLRVDEGDGSTFVDCMAFDEGAECCHVSELNALCLRWTGRSFDTVNDMLKAFKSELGLSRSDVL